VGDVSYSDFTDQFNTALSYGSYYSVIATRRTNSNMANFKAWIDYNIDGNFTDDEMILNSGAISNTKASNKFRVPDLKDCFEGVTRMRVAVSYGSFANTACGVNVVGEFEDYGITLANDKKAPVITLLGSSVVRVEKNSNATACWSESAYSTYTAKDPTEGDLTNKVVIATDLDCTTPGTYFMNFNVLDAAGNAAATVTRNVIVVLDKTPPVLTLFGGASVNVEQCEVYNELGAVASDLTDGNLTSSIKISGSLNTSVVGKYTLTYDVADAQGNASSVTRVINVLDTKKPGIFSYGKRIVDQEVVNIQIGSLFVDAVTGFDTCNGSIAVNKVPGFNGMVNTLVRATYPILYFAKDPHGNTAVEEGFVVNYRVDDYIAPEIALNTPDTVFHDVNSPYSSQPVSVYDNYYTNNKLSVEKKGKVNPFTLGLYTETFTATDESGNTAVRNRYVKVVDRVAPTIITSSVNVCAGDPFWAMSDVSVEDNYYGNNELFPLVKILSHNVNVMRAGMYYINYQVTDPSGNKSQVVLRPVMVRYAPDCENSFVGTENLGLADQVQVYPNPSAGEVTIDFALNNMESITIEVTNLVGAKVAAYTFNGGFGSQVLDLGKFGQGTYLLNIRNQKETTTKKIVIAN
jgi:hypothetical protein